MDRSAQQPLGWLGIIRLGIVQASLGAIVVLTTSTLNRVMVLEYALPALVPGLLVGLHYAVQILRPRWGYGSDRTGRRTPWIVGGMAVLAIGGVLAAVATTLMTTPALGIIVGIFAFLLIGVGVGASGTSLLVLLASRVDDRRRAAAASLVWIMMIAGFVVTATTAGANLDPFSPQRLIAVTAIVSLVAFTLSTLAVWGLEGVEAAREEKAPQPFMETLRSVWAEPKARRFTIFVFISMLAYNAQDLILEPFAGSAFGMTPGQSTKLGGMQHAGVLIGMILVGISSYVAGSAKADALRRWMIGGCIGSAIFLFLLAMSASFGPTWPLTANVIALGVFNGAFAVAAIGSMMALAGESEGTHEGTRMGLWGAAQAIAFALGGVIGTGAADIVHALMGSLTVAYASVFAGEAVLFLFSAWLAVYVARDSRAGVELAAAANAARTSTIRTSGMIQTGA
jgi:BCD family chlorophyll transporter-like MFS transporter